MDDPEKRQLEALIEPRYKKAIEEGRYRDAISICIGFYLACPDGGDRNVEEGILMLLKAAIDFALPQPNPPACSFCGDAEPEVRLVAGTDAFICGACAKTTHEYFSNNISIEG